MLFTQASLTNVLRALDFRGIKIRSTEPGTVEITISGFGRFRKLGPREIFMFRRDKPITAILKIRRKLFGFLLWEIEI